MVVATDYAGLGVGVDTLGKSIVHEYLNGVAQANDVAYSILAAQKAFPIVKEVCYYWLFRRGTGGMGVGREVCF